MTRPCFLVVDREYSQSISTRKLVIETAKFNVLTAYSASEALDTLRKFPAVDGVVVDSDMPTISCPEFIRTLRGFAPGIPVIAVGAPLADNCDGADYELDSFNPKNLLDLLQKIRPHAAAAVEERNRELKQRDQ
jgi:CheY-like chemotaxis protein